MSSVAPNQLSGIFGPLIADISTLGETREKLDSKSQGSFNSMLFPNTLTSNFSGLSNDASALHAYQKHLRTFQNPSFPLNFFGASPLTATGQLARCFGAAKKLAKQQ